MIVSAGVGVMDIPRARSTRSMVPVSRSVPGSDVVSARPPQKPTFNTKWVMKPYIAEPYLHANKMGHVPLRPNQFGFDKDGQQNFPAVLLIDAPLNQPKEMPNTYSQEIRDMMYEDLNIQFEHGLDYKAGMRPSHTPRALKISDINEPATPYPLRRGGVGAPLKFQQTTYDLGKLSLQALGHHL